MKQIMRILLVTAMVWAGVSAQAQEKMDHSMHGSDRIGTLVHESKVEGYTLAYYFMDMREMKGHSMGNMEDKPHHIMVYITDAKGKVVEKARVGLWIRSGDGMDQKTMTMYMSNGFGTMADLKKPGKYTVSTKVVMGDKKLRDRFVHEVK